MTIYVVWGLGIDIEDDTLFKAFVNKADAENFIKQKDKENNDTYLKYYIQELELDEGEAE